MKYKAESYINGNKETVKADLAEKDGGGYSNVLLNMNEIERERKVRF